MADRKVPVQPLVFYSKDGKVSRYNLRKVRFIDLLIARFNLYVFHSLESSLTTLLGPGDLKIFTKMYYLVTTGYMQNYLVVLFKQFLVIMKTLAHILMTKMQEGEMFLFCISIRL